MLQPRCVHGNTVDTNGRPLRDPTAAQVVTRVRDEPVADGHDEHVAADDGLAARRAIGALRNGVPSRDGERGLLLGAGFGAGKSHVLEHLAHLALDRGFVVSRPVISKETPLHDPVKLLHWASGTGCSERFALTVRLLPHAQENDDEFAEAIVRFWSGDPLGVADLRRHTRFAGVGKPALSTVPAREQRCTARPTYAPSTQAVELLSGYAEEPDLES